MINISTLRLLSNDIIDVELKGQNELMIVVKLDSDIKKLMAEVNAFSGLQSPENTFSIIYIYDNGRTID